MYLHIGQNVIVLQKDIIGVFDLDNTTSSRITRDYLARAEKERRVISVFDDIPRSFVVCNDGGGVKIYLSQLSPQTLAARAAAPLWL